MLKKRLVHGIGVNDLPYQVSKCFDLRRDGN